MKLLLQFMKLFFLGLMPFMTKIVDYVHDPELFNPDFPTRPHPH